MTVAERYKVDVEAIIAKRYDNGGDYWASADGRLAVGHPFSTLACTLMLSELGGDLSNPILLKVLPISFLKHGGKRGDLGSLQLERFIPVIQLLLLGSFAD